MKKLLSLLLSLLLCASVRPHQPAIAAESDDPTPPGVTAPLDPETPENPNGPEEPEEPEEPTQPRGNVPDPSKDEV